jgi:hypothetical protein
LAGVKQVGRPDDLADSDDSPEAQQYLMQAWQAMALYLANTDNEDQAGALQVLKMISNLMSDEGEPNQPQPTGAFGTTSYASADTAANTFDLSVRFSRLTSGLDQPPLRPAKRKPRCGRRATDGFFTLGDVVGRPRASCRFSRRAAVFG